jgi:hypothetical protein
MRALNVMLLAVLLSLGATAGCATAPIAAEQPSPTEPTSRTGKTVPRVLVTAQQLIDRGHRLEVAAGTEVVWADGHFDRVWFPPNTGAPRVERTALGYRAVFTKSGTYRGAFTLAGSIRSDDVYPLVVTVMDR